ncbi:phage tail tube protein [Streptomyces sp. NPDC055036]
MANDSGKIRFAPNGTIYIAPAAVDGTTGTVPPVAVGDGLTAPTGYNSLGYVNEGGVTLTPAITTEPVTAWQSAVPVLYNVTAASFSINAILIETNERTTELFWGSSWTEITGAEGTPTGEYRLDLSANPDFQDISIVVDWSEGAIRYRCVIPRAMISERGAIQLNRTANGQYELTMQALDYNGLLGYVMTNDDIIDTP